MARRAALYALGVIFAANFFNYTDRQLVSALEKQLTDAFKLTEAQFGLLWTLFTVGYMLCAIPIGLLADRTSRPKLFAICVVVWSVATVASGLARERWILNVSRVFIGVGEAGCLVVGPSLISDLFAKEARGKALSVFYLGLPLGGTAAFMLAAVPMDWRMMFMIAGVPGFAIAALIWLLPDPPRGGTEGAGHGMSQGGVGDYLALLKNRTLMLIIFAQTFAVIMLIPLIHFGKKFFIDTRGLTETQAGVALAFMALVAGALGNSLSGVIGDKLAKRGIKGAYALLAGIAFLAGWPCLVAGFLSHEKWIFLPALTAGCFFYFLCMPAVNTQIANVTSPAQRATAWAMAVFILHLLGDTLAPPVFGKVSEKIGRDDAFLLFSCSLALAGACSLLAVRTARVDVERVAARIGQETRVQSGA